MLNTANANEVTECVDNYRPAQFRVNKKLKDGW